ncbi:hypothetical protein BKA69DRAFT_1055157 [Paraphysoderma sedebokerense]|nr:hypothetical protein BKA69DRAFT_1055157 [Paraphysoderma sedebokerense]
MKLFIAPLLALLATVQVSAQQNATRCATKLSQNLVHGDFQYQFFTRTLPVGTWYTTTNGQRVHPSPQYWHKGGNPYTGAIFNLENTENVVSHDINFPSEDDNFRISGLYDIKAACNGVFEVILTTRGCNGAERNIVLESVPIAWPNANNQLYPNNNITNRDPRGLDVFFANRGSGKTSGGTLSFRLMCNPGTNDVTGTNAIRSLMLANIRVTPYPRECQPQCGDNILINGDFSHPRTLTGWTPQAWFYGAAAPSDTQVALAAGPEVQNVVSAANSPALRVRSLTFQYSQTVYLAAGASYELSGDWYLETDDEWMFQINTPVYNQRTAGVDFEGPTMAMYHWNQARNCLCSDGRWHTDWVRSFQTPASPNYRQAALVFRAYSFANNSGGSANPNVALLDNLRLVRTDCRSPNANESPRTFEVPTCSSDSNTVSTPSTESISTRTSTTSSEPTGNQRQLSAGSTVKGSAAIAGGVIAAGLAANMV